MKCEDCKYWERFEFYEDEYFNFIGVCRRYPPMIPAKVECDEDKNVCFPETYEDSWCGEFKRRAKK